MTSITSTTSAHDIQATPGNYTSIAKALHWLLGVALIAVFFLGLYMHELPFSPQRLKLYSWHKWAGVSILVLSVLRLVWRATHRPPALPYAIVKVMPDWQHKAHMATHHVLYLLFLAVPLLGWAYSSAAGFPIVMFGLWELPDFVPVSKDLADIIKPLHKFSALAMAGLVVLHVAAALKHQWIDRDGLINRMLPERT
jgi:cytochrome b561